MNRGSTPADTLQSFLGIDVTDPQALRALFNRKAAARDTWPDGADIVISRGLYHKYLRLYDLSWALTAALYNVLGDAEHKLVMKEAQSLGYDLPDIKRFREELEGYRDFLENCDPAGEAVPQRGSKVRMSRDTANMLYELTDYNCFMVAHIFDRCFNTDYMKHFGELKSKGFRYSGATALQETLDVLVVMMSLKDTIDQELDACEAKTAPLRKNTPGPD
ncbi:MAG: hypothetical protein H6867_11355 [Rhodospirillales bacterium]|nr:hypothetical protein [Rhodospirillales bacterium]MCB9996726.1 hypothetical protein [Rhodospirillales bacterium]